MFNFVKLLIIIVSVCFSISAQIETDEATEIEIQQQIGSRYIRCYQGENKLYDAESLKKLTSDERCSAVNLLKIDFAKQSLIGYRVGGDCFLSADAKVFRDDKTKTYSVKINNYWGGCRAGGSFIGWLVVEKIPTDYKIEFKVILLDKRIGDNFGLNRLETLEAREIDLKGCIHTIYTKQFVIKTETEYLKTIRNDASRENCLKNVEKIDFEKNSLLGVEINSGYCDRPPGLGFQVLKDSDAKEYQLNLTYDAPKYGGCRALSQYDLWVLVPKIPEGFTVKFSDEAKK